MIKKTGLFLSLVVSVALSAQDIDLSHWKVTIPEDNGKGRPIEFLHRKYRILKRMKP